MTETEYYRLLNQEAQTHPNLSGQNLLGQNLLGQALLGQGLANYRPPEVFSPDSENHFEQFKGWLRQEKNSTIESCSFYDLEMYTSEFYSI